MRRSVRPVAGAATRPPMRGAAAVLAAAVLLVGCGTDPTDALPCPPVRMAEDTATLTRFAGGGRDLIDVAWEARITGYTGTCGFADDGSAVDVAMSVGFRVSRGPAAEGREGSFSYFVAVPRFYPAEGAKQVLPVTFRFPEGTATTVRLRDEEVRVTIPLPNDLHPREVPVYVGFQLTAEQLEWNRTRTTTPR